MRTAFYLYLLLIIPLSTPILHAQDGAQKKKEAAADLKKAATNLEKSLIENDDSKIVRNYELLAQEYVDKDDLPKAEKYLFKALEIYTTSQNATGTARTMRSIARVQESQNKLRAAARNYKAAGENATDQILKQVNGNDYKRLTDPGNRQSAAQYLNANILLLNKKRNKSEVAATYMQLAELSLKNNDSLVAIDQYGLALPYTADFPGRAIKIYSEIASLHIASNRYHEAVTTLNELLAIARKVKDFDIEIAQLQTIADVYFEMEDTENAIAALKASFKTASANGKTFEARQSLMRLVDHYQTTGEDKASLEIYREFLENLDRIILSDNSLTDAKTFKVTEERIRRLESEKMFRDELISRKNTFNYFLLGSMVLLLLLFAFIVKALYSIKTKNKEIALQSLRREMNPHFLFNSLNSVNQFIAQNNELEANKYLTSYSNLMRNTMENSNKDFVSLSNEIENLTKYLELEHLRFKDKFQFVISVDEKLDQESIWIPNMVIQPHLENAIWHGLRYKENKGLLKLDFSLDNDKIYIIIDDDGIGFTKSAELKTHNQKAHNSLGLNNTGERIRLLNELYKSKISFSITEKTAPKTGTIISINFPIINKI